jgi:hypothetical protein
MVFARGITKMSASKCECSMAIAVLGDGCRYCQPQEYINQLEEWLDEERARVVELEASAVVQEIAACVSPAPHYETQRGLSCKNDTQSAVVPSGVWQFYQDGEWHTGINNIHHRVNTESAGYKVRDLWATQDQDPLN